MDNPSQLTRFLNLTQEMAAAAEKSDWRRVEALEAERQAMLADVGDEIVAGLHNGGGEAIIAQVQEALSLNEHALTLSEAAKGKLFEAITNVGKGRRAVTAYRDVHSMSAHGR